MVAADGDRVKFRHSLRRKSENIRNDAHGRLGRIDTTGCRRSRRKVIGQSNLVIYGYDNANRHTRLVLPNGIAVGGGRLLRLDGAKIGPLNFEIGLVVEDRGMARVGDEDRAIRALR